MDEARTGRDASERGGREQGADEQRTGEHGNGEHGIGEHGDGERVARGACACGGIELRASLPARFVAHCHCGNCRRAHGAGFVTWAGFPTDALEVADRDDLLRAFDTDAGSRRRFCSRCGTPMLFDGPRWPGEVHVAFALLDDAAGLVPEVHAYADRAPDWCPIQDALPRFGGPNGNEPLGDV